MKHATAIFDGNFNSSEYAKAEGMHVMKCLRKLIEQDNKIMRFGIEDSMKFIAWKQVVPPKGPPTLYVKEGLLTLSSTPPFWLGVVSCTDIG